MDEIRYIQSKYMLNVNIFGFVKVHIQDITTAHMKLLRAHKVVLTRALSLAQRRVLNITFPHFASNQIACLREELLLIPGLDFGDEMAMVPILTTTASCSSFSLFFLSVSSFSSGSWS